MRGGVKRKSPAPRSSLARHCNTLPAPMNKSNGINNRPARSSCARRRSPPKATSTRSRSAAGPHEPRVVRLQVIVRAPGRGKNESNEYHQVRPTLAPVQERSSILTATGGLQEHEAPESNGREGKIGRPVVEIGNPQKPALVGEHVIALRLRYRWEQYGHHRDNGHNSEPAAT